MHGHKEEPTPLCLDSILGDIPFCHPGSPSPIVPALADHFLLLLISSVSWYVV
jgi:hypothetical protein